MSATLAIGLAPPIPAPPMRRLIQAYLLVALAVVAAPGLFVHIPPLLDYPNHYTRIWLLAGGIKHGPLAHMYAVDWRSAWTNVGIDVLAQLVGAVVPAQILAPLVVAAALVLPPLGAILVHQRLFGGPRWWQVGIPLAAFPTTLLAGFVNFQIGLGLALLAIAADPWLERRLTPVQVVIVRVLLAAGLLIVHIFALGFYVALLGGLALGPRLAVLFEPGGFKRTVIRLVAAGSAFVIPITAFRLTAPRLPGGGEWAPLWGPTTLSYKLKVLYCAFGTYDLRVDLTCFLALLLIVLLALALRKLVAHQGLLLASLGLIVLALVAPTWAADTAWIDTRVPIMALLCLLACLNPEFPTSPRPAGVAATLLLCLAVSRAVWIGNIWMLRQADVRSVEQALSHVPAGAAVLPLEHRPSARGERLAPIGRYFHFGASFYHDYTLSVMERQAFSPLVFSTPGKQPLKVLQPWEAISVPNGGRSPTFAALKAPSRSWLKVAPYIRVWRQRFDYALMLNADVLEDVKGDIPPEGLQLVADEGFARLYRVVRDPAVAEAAKPGRAQAGRS